MTHPDGFHYPGDGCTGDLRRLTIEERADVRHLTRRILLATAEHRHTDILRHGDHLAQHFGPAGEFLLAVGAALGCDTTTPTPQRAEPLLAHLEHRHRATPAHRRHRALSAAAPTVAEFITAAHHRATRRARTLFNTAYTTAPATTDAHAFTALLLTHAAHTLRPTTADLLEHH